MQLLVPHLLCLLEQRCLFALFKSHISQSVLAHRDVLVPQPPDGSCPKSLSPWSIHPLERDEEGPEVSLCVEQRELMSSIKYKYPCSIVVCVSDMQKYYKKQTPHSRRDKSSVLYNWWLITNYF